MDFSSLLESKAIREHCKSIGYNFNIRQATYIIYNNSKLTLNQKLKYYKYLIDNSLDVDLDCKKYKSYKELLSKYIVETRKLQKCFKRMENCNYTAIIHYKDRPFRKVNISTFDIEELKDFIKTIIKYDKDYLKNMEYIRVVCVCNDAHISYHFNKKSQMLEALNDDILTDLFDYVLKDIEIPLPFKQWDIVCDKHLYKPIPMIFQKSLNVSIDISSKAVYLGYIINDNFTPQLLKLSDHFKLEYYDINPKNNKDNLLMMLYDLLKGKIGLTKFIQFQNKLLLDNLSINGRNISNYTEDDDIYLVKKGNDNE